MVASRKNVIIFDVHLISSENKNRDIFVLGEGHTQGFDGTIITAESKYPINFTQTGKKVALRLHDNWTNSFLLINAVKMYQAKASDSEIKPYLLCLGSI